MCQIENEDARPASDPSALAAPAAIRHYRAGDRATVRSIAYQTSEMGKAAENLIRDPELLSDLLTRYYTDYEPESTWVATDDEGVVGYLTGCMDTRRSERIMARRIVPGAALRAVRRGVLRDPQTWQFLWTNGRLRLRGAIGRHVDLDVYPAHLHLNLLDRFRGRRIGPCLMAAFLDQARQSGVRGVHVSVREENARGRRFFERMGFASVERYPFIHTAGPDGRLVYSVILGQRL